MNSEPMSCAFCGHPDSRHRLVDAIVNRHRAGESVEALADDYRMTVTDVRKLVEVDVRWMVSAFGE